MAKNDPTPTPSAMQAAAQNPVNTAPTSPDVVTVGCKLPSGLMMERHIQLDETDANGRPIKRFVGTGETFTLKGSNSSRVIGGFGITENVPKDFFDSWMSMMKGYQPVAQGLIFAMASTSDVEAEAASRSGVTNGFEGLNPAQPGKGLAPADNKE